MTLSVAFMIIICVTIVVVQSLYTMFAYRALKCSEQIH